MSSPAWLRRALAPVALSVLAGSLSAACGGGGTPLSSASASQQPSSAAQSAGPAWQGVLGQVQPDGTVPLATALAAFTLAVGPLPGVATPAGTAGQLTDGTVGVRWVIGHWAQLTAAQQAAVEQYLVAPAKAQAVGAPTGGAVELASYTPSRRRPELTGAVSASGYLAQAQHFRSIIAADLGRDTPQDLKVVINTAQKEGKAYAYTSSFDSSWGFSGKAAHCVIYINPLLYATKDAGLATMVVAHEMFHCFQADDFSSLYAFGTAPAWVVEGQAEWVGSTLEPVDDGWWVPYLTDLSTAPNPTNINSVLFVRTYDAIGFYAHMAESGINPWGRLDDMLKAAGDVAAYDTAVNEAFRKDWASSVSRRPGLGQGWDTTGPGIPSEIFEPVVTILR